MTLSQNWENLIKPYKIAVEKQDDERRKGTIVIEPLEKGFGVTIGNTLRRVLLSSLQGAAVTSIKIEETLSEFSSIPGIIEDVPDMILNIKLLSLKIHGKEPQKVHLVAKGPCVVTAEMIHGGGTLEILDPSQEICTLNESGKIDMEMVVEVGKGYVPAVPQHLAASHPIGTIFLDADFTPVKNVAFHVETTRVGQLADYDKLILTVETDGSVAPKEAVCIAAYILKEQFNLLTEFTTSKASEHIAESHPVKKEVPFLNILLKNVQDLDLNVRCLNCLQNANIVYVGDLVTNKEDDLLKTPNFGRKSLNEIKAKLEEIGMSLGMEVEEWPPEDMEKTIKENQTKEEF